MIIKQEIKRKKIQTKVSTGIFEFKCVIADQKKNWTKIKRKTENHESWRNFSISKALTQFTARRKWLTCAVKNIKSPERAIKLSGVLKILILIFDSLSNAWTSLNILMNRIFTLSRLNNVQVTASVIKSHFTCNEKIIVRGVWVLVF